MQPINHTHQETANVRVTGTAPEGVAYRTANESDTVPKDDPNRRLTFIEEAFVREYIRDYNIAAAARRVGWTDKTANQALDKPHIRRRMDELFNSLNESALVSQEEIKSYLVRIMKSQLDDLVEIYQGACRHCWGYDVLNSTEENRIFNFHYQYIDEFERDNDLKKNDGEYRKGYGGLGYNKRMIPNPECPHCAGDGLPRHVLKDSTSIESHYLIQSIELDKQGRPYFKLHDKLKAIDMLTRMLGGYEKDNAQKADASKLTIMGGIDHHMMRHALQTAGVNDLEKALQESIEESLRGGSAQGELDLGMPK